MNPGILDLGYAPPQMPRPLLGQPQPVPTPYGRAGDPYWGNVSLYLRMDGPHGSRTFTDLSRFGLLVSVNGGPRIDHSQFVFEASASLNASVTTDSLTVPNSGGQFDVGTGDFTVESFCRFSAIGAAAANQRCVFCTGASGIAVTFWNNRIRFARAEVANVADYAALAITTNSWFHWAVARSGTDLRVFVNGRVVGSTTYSVSLTPTGSTTFAGNYISTAVPGISGWLDEFRFTRGVARYTSNFPPPTAPFPIGYQ